MNEKVKKAVADFRKKNGIPSGFKYKGMSFDEVKAKSDKVIPITLEKAKEYGFAPSLQCNGFFDCLQNGEKVFYEWAL